MKHLFSWVLLIIICSLSLTQLHYVKELKSTQKHVEILRNKPTVMNIPTYDGTTETIQSYMALGVLSTGQNVPAVIPVLISEKEYELWSDKARIAYAEQIEKLKIKKKTQEEKP